jgi:phosphodiesterase/alkaline phosphatase D-like protein
MTVSEYWVAQWLDDHEITNEWELTHVMNTRQGMESIAEAVIKGAQHLDTAPLYGDGTPGAVEGIDCRGT